MRYWVGTVVVVLALVAVGGAGSASTNVNPNGIALFPVEGVSFSGLVANFTDPTAPAHSEYTATIEWGDGDVTAGSLVSTGGNQNSFDVNGQHTYAEEGAYQLRITIKGGSGTGLTTPKAAVSDAPLTLHVQAPAIVEGGSPSGPIATFTDLDTAEVATAFTATIDWGDGTSGRGTVARTGAGAFNVSANHTFGEEGQFTVGVTVKDAGGSTASANQAVMVGDAPLTAGAPFTLHGTERKAHTSSVATFHDGFASAPVTDFTAMINWGDGKSSPGTVAAAPGGGWQVIASHAYADEGRYTTSVTVKDKGGATTTIPGAAVIADAPLRARSACTWRSAWGKPSAAESRHSRTQPRGLL
jgi:PKD repeat protein